MSIRGIPGTHDSLNHTVSAQPCGSEWAHLGSNQGPPACEAGALPLSYAPQRGEDSNRRLAGIQGAGERRSALREHGLAVGDEHHLDRAFE